MGANQKDRKKGVKNSQVVEISESAPSLVILREKEEKNTVQSQQKNEAWHHREGPE